MNTLINTSTGAAFWAFLSGKARQLATFIVCASVLASGSLFAQTPTPTMPPMKPELEARLRLLETELRCLVCQNQTLADSPAGLAGDLRREIRLLAESGKNNEEIKEHLKARYGDFVLYKPSVESKTWLLWFGPFVLLLGGAIIGWRVARRRTAKMVATPDLSDEERLRAGKLMNE
jgi:cytochrome c-type biogenesis protein CcmH